MKWMGAIGLLILLWPSVLWSQGIVGPGERLWGEGDQINGETLTTIREGGIDDQGNAGSNPFAEQSVGGSGSLILATFNDIPVLISRASDLVPGGDIIESFSDHVERDGNFLLYTALRVDNDPTNGAGDTVLLLRDLLQNDPIIIARTNVTTVPGRAVPFTRIKSGEGFGLAPGPRIAFAAEFVDGTPGEGVYLWDNGVLSTIVDTDDVFDGTAFTSFDDAKPDENGTGVVFSSQRDNGFINSIVRFDGGVLTELISEEDPYPGSSDTIINFGTPDIDGDRVVVSVEGAGGQKGIFLFDEQNTPTLIVDLNTVLPDGPTQSGAAEDLLGLTGIGGDALYFLAQRPGSLSSELFIWNNGVIERVLSPGDVLDGNLVTTPASGLQRHGISRGGILASVRFEGGDEALYRFSFSPLLSAPALPVPLTWIGLPLAVMLLMVGVLATRPRASAR